jgi:hypothetical protein
MDLHDKLHFDTLLDLATERLVARLEERHRGPEGALGALRRDVGEPNGFVGAFFRDFLLDNADGACFVLRSLPRESIEGCRNDLHLAVTAEDAAVALARGLFAALLRRRTIEALERRLAYDAMEEVA